MTTELEIQRRLTAAFINTMPVMITLVPQVKAQTPSGGYTWQSGVPRAAQKMRFVEPSTQAGALPRPLSTGDGMVRKIDFMLLGEWDAVIEANDVFTHDGVDWDVVEVAQSNGWEQRALAARHG